MRRTIASAIAVVSLTSLVSACNGKGDTGSTTSASPSNTQQALPFAGAPKVPDPLPASVLAGDPCTDALTPEQVKAAVGIEVSGTRNDLAPLGPGCVWSAPATGAKVAITYDTQTHTGLSGVYQNTKPKTTAWKELSAISGFPAVAHGFTEGDCQISIGLADDLAVDVTGFVSRNKQGTVDPCQATAETAADMIAALRQRAGA